MLTISWIADRIMGGWCDRGLSKNSLNLDKGQKKNYTSY